MCKAAAERGFFRILKELRQIEKEAKAAGPAVDDETFQKTLASFFQLEKRAAEFEARYPEPAPMLPSKSSKRFEPVNLPPIRGGVDVPITIGRSR